MERMTVVYAVIAAVVVFQVRAEIVDLNCSDNATCINHMMKEFVKSIRQQKTVRVFDTLTIAPKEDYLEGRARQGLLAKFMNSHSFTFDWDNYAFRLSRPVHRSDALELEVFEGRSSSEEPTTVKPEQASKKSDSKESKEEEEKSPKRLRRRQSRKILQALIPFLFGMKSAGTVIFAMTVVAILTFKAYVASKMALMVTLGMAVKRIYDAFGHGVGLQNHPYLYSQYPIDFPSASSHAYSVAGVNPQHFASPEIYSPTALASHSHQHEMLQQSDASAQQSQQAPAVANANATRASERWDGIRRHPMSYSTSRATSDHYSDFKNYRH